MEINGIKITGKNFAWDGCHKIYILANASQVRQARAMGYSIFKIKSIKDCYESSCSLKFISSWDLLTDYISQFEDANFSK